MRKKNEVTMITDSIYVIDDEQVAREVISFTLRKSYRVRAFSSAEAAIGAMSSDSPDLVLLDIGLPGMSGIEALDEIKRRYPEMIVIMMTAYDDEGMVVSAMSLGAYDYLVKPLEMQALIDTIQYALQTATTRGHSQTHDYIS